MPAIALMSHTDCLALTERDELAHPALALVQNDPAPPALRENPHTESSALRLARQIYAAWLQSSLRQGAYRPSSGAVSALPRVAIEHQLDCALQEAGVEANELLPLDQAQRTRLAALSGLTKDLASGEGQQSAAVQTWNRLIDLGLEVLQGFADMEIVFAAQRAAHDPLTGLPGRAALQQRLQAEQAQVLRHARHCSVVIVDLDHFKQINDRYGHHSGDRVLVAFARMLRGALRPYDGVYRYGGEEFVLVLPGATVAQAVCIVDRIRLQLAARPLMRTQTGALPVGFSAGVAALNERPIAQILRCADQALYLAKAGGRDQVQRERCASA
ncbi:MAG: diguanylate cyclase [Thiomonas sp.]|jgi:diguanylate cyclase (GGDEF)-like protein